MIGGCDPGAQAALLPLEPAPLQDAPLTEFRLATWNVQHAAEAGHRPPLRGIRRLGAPASPPTSRRTASSTPSGRLHPQAVDHSWFGRSGNGYRFDHVFVSRQHRGLPRTCRYLHQPRLEGLSDHAAMTVTLTLHP